MVNIRMFLLRVMRDKETGNVGVGIAEVDNDSNIIYTYSLFLGKVSRREAYRAYSGWLLNHVGPPQTIEVCTNDEAATNRREQKYDRLKYFLNSRLIWHGALNWVTSTALYSQKSQELMLESNKGKGAEK